MSLIYIVFIDIFLILYGNKSDINDAVFTLNIRPMRRIYHKREDGVDKFAPMNTVWHHDLWADPEGDSPEGGQGVRTPPPPENHNNIYRVS